MSESDSLIRAAVTKTILRGVDRLSTQTRGQIIGRAGHDTVRRAREHFNLGWVPTGEHVDILVAIHDVLGTNGTRELFKTAYLDEFAGLALTRSIINGAIRLFGSTPAGLARVMPRAWETLSRNAGHFDFRARGSGCVELHYRDLGPSYARKGEYAPGFWGTFDGFMAQCGAHGTVRMVGSDPATGSTTFRFEWV